VIEVRDRGPGWWSMSGTASTWLHRSRPYFVSDLRHGTFLEQVSKAAFDWSGGADLRLEHRADGPRFANTRTGTLSFENNNDGLLLGAALSKSDPAKAGMVAQVHRGELRGLSVGTRVLADGWGKALDNRTQLRTIAAAELHEVSVVARAANKATTVDVRHEQRSSNNELEFRSVALVAAWPFGVDDDDLEGELWQLQVVHSRRMAELMR